MPGVRIHHPTLRNAILIVPHPGDPTTGRLPKDYHIRIDTHGDAIVSETVWGRLQQAKQSNLSGHDFLVTGEVKDPPALILGGRPDGLPIRKQLGDIISDVLGPLPDGAQARLNRPEGH